MDYETFLEGKKAFLIAPAGHGKTFTLAEAIAHSSGVSLILTHTHAGVSSIANKLNSLGVEPRSYCLETISSFIQKYVMSFYVGDDIPPQEDSKVYHPFLLEKAKGIFSKPIIKRIIKSSFYGIFVDEYQDCSKQQHQILMTISENISIRGLGDPLQGIFDFNDDIVDFSEDLSDFTTFEPLKIPYRWINVGRPCLGNSLLHIREQIEDRKDINLKEYSNEIELLIADEREKFDSQKPYFKILNSLQNEDSLLFIHPDSINKNSRLSLARRFKRMTAIESIDDVDFYKLAKIADDVFDSNNRVVAIKELAYELFNKTELDKWFNKNGFKRKQKDYDRKCVARISELVDKITDVSCIKNILTEIHGLKAISPPRPELYHSLQSALNISAEKGIPAYNAMVEQRNRVRRSGRHITGKHIGTTLLTKGLEFDVVVVLDAHKFKCHKHLYVALTRCCKRLIIISNSTILSPYKDQPI